MVFLSLRSDKTFLRPVACRMVPRFYQYVLRILKTDLRSQTNRHSQRATTNYESPRLRRPLRGFASELGCKSASLRNNLEGRLISPPNHPICNPVQRCLMPATFIGCVHSCGRASSSVGVLNTKNSYPSFRISAILFLHSRL